MEKLSVCGDRFLDFRNRHVILHGINLVYKGDSKAGKQNYIGPWTKEDFVLFSELGFNVIRIGLIWDAVEPEPGRINQEYLDWIAYLLDLCHEHGIYAYLDMHQDLYSVLYSDGAPKWATLTDGRAHSATSHWSDAYLLSDAVQRAFDNFWDNVAAPDGKGLQDHFIAMWQQVVVRFASHPAVFGYDFFNEPYPGTPGVRIFHSMMGALSEIYNRAQGSNLSPQAMGELIFSGDPAVHGEVLRLLENPSHFRAMHAAAAPLTTEFEQQTLGPFYQRIANAVRLIDRNGIILREHNYFCNMGIPCQAHPLCLENGARDPQQAYSPHGYDLLVDTPQAEDSSNQRIEVIFAAQRQTQSRIQVPTLVGEWGAHYKHTQGLNHLEQILAIFERNLWSNTYWCYQEGFHKFPAARILKRSYPQAVAGRLLAYRFDRPSKVFSMEWEETETAAPTIVYIPGKPVSVDGIDAYDQCINGDSTVLEIPPTGKQRRLTVRL